MLFASDAQERERTAEAQRYQLGQVTQNLALDMFALTGQARQYVITGDPTHLAVYKRTGQALASVENRIRHVHDAGAR